MNPELAAVAFGLTAAACWGAGDFSGGVASRRNGIYSVIIISQIVGFVLMVGLALGLQEPFPATPILVWGMLGGISGTLGLMALYLGLSTGRMGVVAPVSALVTGIVPVLVGMALEGLPSTSQFAGFALALVAVGLISRSGETSAVTWLDLRLPIAAGLGFGLFFVFMDQVSDEALFWPLVSARVVSLLLLILFVSITRRSIIPDKKYLPLIIMAGIFDVGGNAFFMLATRAGRLDISAVVGSLYPAATVLLAWIILKEHISRIQWIGILIALIAVVLITS